MTPSAAACLLSKRQLLIFDLDGTLVDSSPIHARAFQEAFASHEVQVDYGSIAGLTTEAAVRQIAAVSGVDLCPADLERLVADKRSRALRLIEAELTSIDGAVDFVHAAEGRFALALCTSASRAATDMALQRVGLGNCFEPVVTAELVRQGKPDPETFLLALEAHGVAPSEALVFEDSDSGLAAAASAGIDAVRIGSKEHGGSDWRPFVAALQEFEL